jgi:NitT/TauT family transport system substrate-binding protein
MMSTRHVLKAVLISMLMLSCYGAPSLAAPETVVTGVLGSYTSGAWPFLISVKKGFFARRGIVPDVVFARTAPGLVQQLAAGSLDVVAVNGLAEPIHAVEKGAGVAILRIIGQTPNYVMVARSGIKDTLGLKGKKIAIGGLNDINRIYLDRMMAPTGLTDKDYDIIVIGATGARFAALQSGAIDATMLVPPFNFAATKAGFNTIGLVRDFAKDLPQTGMQVSRRWAESHRETAKQILAATDEGVAWFYDGANREEAIDILAEASKSDRQEVAESYDFLVKLQYFAPTSAIQREPLTNMMKDMANLNDIAAAIPVERLVIDGLNPIEN